VSPLSTRRGQLQALLWLVALHSVVVGVGLVLHPAGLLAAVGYAPLSEPFFPTQGGVFHFVMAIAYVLGARDPVRHEALIRFAVVVKFVALVFLVGYWLLHRHLLVVLGSGLADGVMGASILVAYRRWRKERA
jgi:hypothetical protein